MVSKNGKRWHKYEVMTRLVTKHEDSHYVNLPPSFIKRSGLKVGSKLFVITGRKTAVVTSAYCTSKRLIKIISFLERSSIA